MKKLCMISEFNNENLIWEDLIIPMWRDIDNLPNPTLIRSEINQVMQRTADPNATREAVETIFKILDSEYEKSNLEEISQL